MFVDKVRVRLIAGSGGNGVVAWRRERYIPKGGPCGGNGGKGGSIYLQADSQISSLEAFCNRRIIRAENGRAGEGSLRTGRKGRDLILKVPYGTLISEVSTGTILYDFIDEPRCELVCRGGIGGKGNAYFKSATNQAPNLYTKGSKGDEKEVELQLKLIADVGLIGLPNAGKSSIISSITPFTAKVAPYPFTTLFPNLSYLKASRRILVADIPGIISEAHLNRGLGFEFLKHVERSSLLVYVIDASGLEGRTPMDDFTTLRYELEQYRPFLLTKPSLVVLNKMDLEGAIENARQFQNRHPKISVIQTSTLNGQGIQQLITAVEAMSG